jgi:hypothetical protein
MPEYLWASLWHTRNSDHWAGSVEEADVMQNTEDSFDVASEVSVDSFELIQDGRVLDKFIENPSKILYRYGI